MGDSREYWLNKERRYLAQWTERMSPSPIEWLDRHYFWKIFDETYRINNRTISKFIYFPMRLQDIRARILIPPVFTPFEEDFPGPVERWYGRVGQHLFLFTHYYHHEDPFNNIDIEKDDEVEKIIMEALNIFKNCRVY